jgi:hypothetical protein
MDVVSGERPRCQADATACLTNAAPVRTDARRFGRAVLPLGGSNRSSMRSATAIGSSRPPPTCANPPATLVTPHPIIALTNQPSLPVSIARFLRKTTLGKWVALNRKNIHMKDQAVTVRARRLSEPAPEFNHRFTHRNLCGNRVEPVSVGLSRGRSAYLRHRVPRRRHPSLGATAG